MTFPFPLGKCTTCPKPARPGLIYCDEHDKRAGELKRMNAGLCSCCKDGAGFDYVDGAWLSQCCGAESLEQAI